MIAQPDTRPWTQAAPRRIPGAPVTGAASSYYGQGTPQVGFPSLLSFGEERSRVCTDLLCGRSSYSADTKGVEGRC